MQKAGSKQNYIHDSCKWSYTCCNTYLLITGFFFISVKCKHITCFTAMGKIFCLWVLMRVCVDKVKDIIYCSVLGNSAYIIWNTHFLCLSYKITATYCWFIRSSALVIVCAQHNYENSFISLINLHKSLNRTHKIY